LPYDGTDYVKVARGTIKGLRIAFSPTLGYVEVDPQIARLVAMAVHGLKALGAKVTIVDPGFADPVRCFRDIWWGGARAALGGLSATKKALLEPALADVVKQAEAISVEDVYEAARQRALLGSQMRQFMEDYDVLVTPTLPIAAFDAGRLEPSSPDPKGKWVNWTPFTYPFNLTQQPAASIGCGFTKEGLPAGLHVVGRMFDDATVLKVAAAHESVTRFYELQPAMAI
jgi:aspartyl-tRNA(Asn)/glutamyl-tRNA(Gln) amidotransferase subunit A